MDTDQLRQAAKAVFLATKEEVAKDISGLLKEAANKIDVLRARLAERDELIMKSEWIWRNCRVICWTNANEYQLEHDMRLGRNMREAIEGQMPTREAE